MTDKERAELEYLRFFFNCADFGPAHEDVVTLINEAYEETGKRVPKDYDYNWGEDENAESFD